MLSVKDYTMSFCQTHRGGDMPLLNIINIPHFFDLFIIKSSENIKKHKLVFFYYDIILLWIC